MTWMLTANAHQVDMRYPRLGAITLADIGHHLSIINRFCGATCRPYSVAEHSLLVVEILQREFELEDPHALFAGLMHDAHEAYTNDVSTPAKGEIEGWAAFEGRFERTVRSAFALATAAYTHRLAIKQADLIALATERAQLLPKHAGLWEVLVHVEPVTWVDLMSPQRLEAAWYDWRLAFTNRAEQLDFARQAKTFPTTTTERQP